MSGAGTTGGGGSFGPPGDGGATAGAGATLSSGLGEAASGAPSAFGMLGDQGPFFIRIRQVPGFPQVPPIPPTFPPNQPPTTPNPQTRSLLSPSVRGFKIAENQSPIPQDRLFYSFNYFDDVNKALNRSFESPIDDLKVQRHVFGFEKTFDQGKGSVGLRLPLNSIYAGDRTNFRAGGNSTALGDLTVYTKYILKQTTEGHLMSVGLAVTPPTGPDSFGNASFLRQTPSLHTTTIQPFVGYYLSFGDLFVHGFSALDVPVNFLDVTLLYNDVGVGYYAYRSDDPDALLTALVPTLEAHLTTPLNHRGEYDLFDRAGTPDVLNLTAGVNFEFARSGVLTLGVVAPVTGPRPFDVEAVALFNLRFGGSRSARRSIIPVIGG